MKFLHFRGRKRDPRYSLRPDPVHSVPGALRDSFCERVRSGDVEGVLSMLNQEPLLSRAKTICRGPGIPLLLAAVHPDTRKAVEMIDLLMGKGAALGARDIRERNALLLACRHGVEWVVVECLMKWNASKGGRVLRWSHCDGNANNSSLLLACLGGHTQLALRLLDEIDIEKYATQNHPFHVLEAVLKFGDEAHALAIAEHPNIQAAIGATDMQRYKGGGGPQREYTLQKCVELAVTRRTASVLRLMDYVNHPNVSKATWLAIFGISVDQKKARRKPTNPAILGIADQFVKDRRWDEVKGLFLLRHRGQDVESEDGQLRADLLADLPDHPFRLVVEFSKLRMTCSSDVREISMEVYMEMLFFQ